MEGGRSETRERYRRYASYVCPELPSSTEWNDCCHYQTMLLLFVWSCNANITNWRRQKTIHGMVFCLYTQHAPNLGPLGGAHSWYVAIKAGLGPPWFKKCAVFKGDSRVLTKHFAQRYFERNSFRPAAESERLVETTKAHLVHHFQDQFEDDKMENLFCSK